MMPFLISTGGAFHDIDTLEGDIGSHCTNSGAPPGTETQDNSIYRHNADMTWQELTALKLTAFQSRHNGFRGGRTRTYFIEGVD